MEDVSKLIFDNKGFTSVVPEMNADYANCFALGRNGVKVIFAEFILFFFDFLKYVLYNI